MIESGGGGLDGGGSEEFEADHNRALIAVHPEDPCLDHVSPGGKGADGVDVQGNGVAGDEGGGERESEAKAAGTNVGRLPGVVAGGARLVNFHRSLLPDSQSSAALGVGCRWRAASVQKRHHASVIGTIGDWA